MEQPKSPDTGGIDHGLTGHLELASKVETGQVVTLVISKDRLPSYLRVASETGFKVEKIADEGGEFPCLTGGSGEIQRRANYIKVEGKGSIAVSIEKPEGSKDHAPFWNNLRSLA